MPTDTLHRVVGHVRCAIARTTDLPATDGQLLARFTADRDDAAFTALVRRHGPMVLGVCRRVTGDFHLAEDALQATFLVLARRAVDVSPPDRLGPWLYGVAGRAARAVRKDAWRRVRRERPTEILPDRPGPEADDLWDLGPVLDEEIQRLPAKYRDLLVACELQGRRPRDLARLLGVPEGTVASRLSTARRMLGERLIRRGVALSVAALLGAVRDAAAVVPWGQLTPAARIGRTDVGEVPGAAAALVTRGTRIMRVNQLRIVAACLVVIAGAALGAVYGGDREGDPPPPPRPVPVAKPAAPPAKPTGPGKLLVWRQGHLCALAPDGTGEVRVSEDRQKHMPTSLGAKWSPDGKRYAYIVRAAHEPDQKQPAGQVFVRALDEKEPGTDLGVTGDWMVWSPDGSQLLVVEFEEGTGTVTNRLVDLKTKKTTDVTLPDGYTFAVTDWSRDGKYFLAAGLKAGAKEEVWGLYLIPRAGGAPVALIPEGQTTFTQGAVLSPDGRKVLYMADDPERKDVKDRTRAEAHGLFVLDVKDKKPVRLDGQPIDATIEAFCWSPDGKRLAYTWHRETDVPNDPQKGKKTDCNLVVADADGGNAKAVLTEAADGYGLILLGGVDWR